MATGAYVLYTREFTGGQIGVFVDRSRNYLDKSGAVNGGAIKFANLKLRQSSPSSKLIAKGKDFTVNILGTGSLNQMLEIKANTVALLSRQNRKVINFVALHIFS
jgi:hypothetical protein